MKVKVMFFGRLTEIVNGKDEQFFTDITSVSQLIEKVETKYPLIKNYTYKIALNREIILDNQSLEDNDEVALMPPFAGG